MDKNLLKMLKSARTYGPDVTNSRAELRGDIQNRHNVHTHIHNTQSSVSRKALDEERFIIF